MNESIPKAVTVIRDAAEQDDLASYKKLVADGIEPLSAGRLVVFLPMI